MVCWGNLRRNGPKHFALCLRSSNYPKYFHPIPSYQMHMNELSQRKICMSHGPVTLFSEHRLVEWNELMRLINVQNVFLWNFPCVRLLSMAIRILDRIKENTRFFLVVFQGFPTQNRYLCHQAVEQPSCYAGNGRLKMAPVPMVWERKEAKACRSSTNRCVATGLIIKEIHLWEPCHRPTSSRKIVRRWSMTMWIDLKTHTQFICIPHMVNRSWQTWCRQLWGGNTSWRIVFVKRPRRWVCKRSEPAVILGGYWLV